MMSLPMIRNAGTVPSAYVQHFLLLSHLMIRRLFNDFSRFDMPLHIALFGICSLIAAGAAAQDISPAEKLLFQTNHMQSIRTPVTLTYSYRKEGAAEAGFEDEVQVDVTRINPDKSVAVSVRFLSGDKNIPLPRVGNALGNPALLGFLERDIVEMKRLTGGSTGYFRKRIRLALAEAQSLRPVRFVYAGKGRQGQEVHIQPYLNDPLRERFAAYQDKSYVFILSEEVPGSLYQVRASSIKADLVETLTLVKGKRSRPAAKE
jgi:hypothetical protein